MELRLHTASRCGTFRLHRHAELRSAPVSPGGRVPDRRVQETQEPEEALVAAAGESQTRQVRTEEAAALDEG